MRFENDGVACWGKGKPVDNMTGTLLVAASQATVLAPTLEASVTVFIRDDAKGSWSRTLKIT